MDATNETPNSPPVEPPKPAAKRRSQLLRRDFLVGAAAGAIGAKAADLVTPPEWNLWWGAPRGAKLSYAQNGEDLVVRGAFGGLKIDAPTYLDVGAWEPIESNNTYFFYRKGGRGVLVEPNVDMTPKLKRKRPRDVVLTAGIGTGEVTEADYFVMTDSQLNTFDKEQAERLARDTTTKIKYRMTMPLLSINVVMAEHFGGSAPDYLSVDVEGMELPILKSLDYAKFRPKVICVDSLVTATTHHRPEVLTFMTEKGYELRGMTYANTVFVDKALLGA